MENVPTGDDEGENSDIEADSPSFSETSNQLVTSSSSCNDTSDSSFTAVWLHLINHFLHKIEDILDLDGLQAIPFLQVGLLHNVILLDKSYY